MTILPQRLSNFLKELSQALALGWLCLRKFLCPKADSQGRWVWTALLPNRKDLNLISQRTATKGFQIFSDPSLSKQSVFLRITTATVVNKERKTWNDLTIWKQFPMNRGNTGVETFSHFIAGGSYEWLLYQLQNYLFMLFFGSICDHSWGQKAQLKSNEGTSWEAQVKINI